MDVVYFTLWFMVTVAMIWDTRRGNRRSEEIVREIHASAERIAQMTAEVLRRTPER
jgi:hypothetical protein